MLTFKEYKVPVELLVKHYLCDAANFIKEIIQTDKHVDTHTHSRTHALTHHTHRVVRVCVCMCTYISDIIQDRFSHRHKAIMGLVVPDNLF